EALINLPTNLDLTQVRITGQASPCDTREYDITTLMPSGNGASWDQIAPGGGDVNNPNSGYWEWAGALYPFNKPQVSSCGGVSFDIPYYIYPGGGMGGQNSHVAWKIDDDAGHTATLDTYGSGTYYLSESDMQGLFGSSFFSRNYT